MKKKIYEFLYLSVVAFVFSGQLIASGKKDLKVEQNYKRNLSFLESNLCTSTETLYPLKNFLDETCHHKFNDQFNNEVSESLVDIKEKDSLIQSIN